MKQHHAARCALADLFGALQDYQRRGSDGLQDYEPQTLTNKEFVEAFGLEDEVLEDYK
jgi:hypothetical protein